MSTGKKIRAVIVDDEELIRATRAGIFRSAGYDASTAKDGFDALLELRNDPLPNVIISDLNMPHMSGFEFLSVIRRRFPHIPVIASGGASLPSDEIPIAILADAFHAKGGSPETLITLVAELCKVPAKRMIEVHRHSAPVWINRNAAASATAAVVVISCPECLRSFPVRVSDAGKHAVQKVHCIYCPTVVRYIVDRAGDSISPRYASESVRSQLELSITDTD